MLAFDDPRAKKRKKHGGTSQDRYGAKAESSAATSYVVPEPSVGADSEMVRSVRSDPKGHAPPSRDGGVVGARRQITDREIHQYELSDTEAGRRGQRPPARTGGFDMVAEEDSALKHVVPPRDLRVPESEPIS